MTEHEKRIRKALEAGPTEGPWASEVDDANPNELNIVSNNRPYVATAWPADASNDREQEANAAFIAACNPAAIRALLADLDAMRGALEAERGRIVDLVEGRACHHNGPHLLTLELNQLASVIKSGMGWLEYERAKHKGASA